MTCQPGERNSQSEMLRRDKGAFPLAIFPIPPSSILLYPPLSSSSRYRTTLTLLLQKELSLPTRSLAEIFRPLRRNHTSGRGRTLNDHQNRALCASIARVIKRQVARNLPRRWITEGRRRRGQVCAHLSPASLAGTFSSNLPGKFRISGYSRMFQEDSRRILSRSLRAIRPSFQARTENHALHLSNNDAMDVGVADGGGNRPRSIQTAD